MMVRIVVSQVQSTSTPVSMSSWMNADSAASLSPLKLSSVAPDMVWIVEGPFRPVEGGEAARVEEEGMGVLEPEGWCTLRMDV